MPPQKLKHEDLIAVLQHQALPSFFAFCSEDLIHQTKAMKRFLRQRESTLDKFCAAMECCPVSAAVRTAARRHAEDLLRQHRAAEEQALAAEGERLGRMLMEQLGGGRALHQGDKLQIHIPLRRFILIGPFSNGHISANITS